MTSKHIASPQRKRNLLGWQLYLLLPVVFVIVFKYAAYPACVWLS